MKMWIMSVLGFGLIASAFSAANPSRTDSILFQSLQETSTGAVKTLKGEVRIETRDVIIHADKATFNADTLDIQPVGHVHITLKPR
jgi:lipopolysaccharide assembly outer membrane protein LptD (OstA)